MAKQPLLEREHRDDGRRALVEDIVGVEQLARRGPGRHARRRRARDVGLQLAEARLEAGHDAGRRGARLAVGLEQAHQVALQEVLPGAEEQGLGLGGELFDLGLGEARTVLLEDHDREMRQGGAHVRMEVHEVRDDDGERGMGQRLHAARIGVHAHDVHELGEEPAVREPKPQNMKCSQRHRKWVRITLEMQQLWGFGGRQRTWCSRSS